jgi:hypothetical protein
MSRGLISKMFPLEIFPRNYRWSLFREGQMPGGGRTLRAERTGSYVSTQGRPTTPQMAFHGQALKMTP